MGSSLALSLEEAGHTVAVVERNPAAFRRLGDGFQGARITGVGFDRDVLRSAEIERASAVAAVTNGDNTNILVARVAKETFGVARVTARIYDPQRAAIYERLGIPTVATVAWTSERILRHIVGATAAVDWIDPTAHFVLVERLVTAACVGRSVTDIEAAIGGRIVLVRRLGAAQLPPPTLLLQEGDAIHALVPGSDENVLDQVLTGATIGGGHH